MAYNRDTFWRLHEIGGADLALRYAEIAGQSHSIQSTEPEQNRGLEIVGISFYEGEIHSGTGTPNLSSRFPRSTTSYINYWANLRHGWRYASFNYKLAARYFKPDETLWSETEYPIVAVPERPCFWHSAGWGWKDPGKWQPGDYRIELVIDGLRSRSGTFTIFEDWPQNRFDSPFDNPLISFAGLRRRKGDSIMDKDQPKGLGFDGWLNKLSADLSAAREQPRFDPSKPLDEVGKMRALMAIDQRYMLASSPPEYCFLGPLNNTRVSKPQ